MKIRVKKSGQIIDGAHWFGFNHWIRAWVGSKIPGEDNGFLHWHISEIEILSKN